MLDFNPQPVPTGASLQAKIAIVLELEIRPDRVAEFLKIAADDARCTIAEPGCDRFDFLRDPSCSNKFTFCERPARRPRELIRADPLPSLPTMRSEHPELARPLKRCLGALATVSRPWVLVCGSLEPPRRDGENAQKTGENGEKMGEIRPRSADRRCLAPLQMRSTAARRRLRSTAVRSIGRRGTLSRNRGRC